MAYTKNEKSDSPMKRRGPIRRRKKVCVFCGKETSVFADIDTGYFLRSVFPGMQCE